MAPPRNPRVYEALRAYCEAALALAASSYDEEDDYLRETAHWREGPENIFRRVVVEQPDPSHLLLRIERSLEDLPAYAAAIDTILRDEVFGPQADTIVGTVFAAHRREPMMILRGLLRALLRPGFAFDEDVFNESYSELEETFYRDTIPYAVIVPLRGLAIERPPLELETGVELDVLAEEEVAACLDAGLLRGPLDHVDDAVHIDSHSRFALRLRGTLTKHVGSDPLDSAEWGKLLDDHESKLDSAVGALRLHRPGDIAPESRVMLIRDWFVRRRSVMPGVHGPRTWFGEYSLPAEEHDRLRHIYEALRSDRITRNGGLLLAIRRFSMAADRTLPEDTLLDTMIAAEALFLSDSGGPEDRGELGYRLSLRAAFLLGEDSGSRRSVQRAMQRAYGVRSRIAHGAEVSVVKTSNGGEVDLRTFADEVHRIMRSALLAVIERAPDRGPLADWNALIFGS